MTPYSSHKVTEFVDNLQRALNGYGDTPTGILLFIWMVESGLGPSADKIAFAVHHDAVWHFEHTLNSWEKANVMYELLKIVEPITRVVFKRLSRNARREDGDYE